MSVLPEVVRGRQRLWSIAQERTTRRYDTPLSVTRASVRLAAIGKGVRRAAHGSEFPDCPGHTLFDQKMGEVGRRHPRRTSGEKGHPRVATHRMGRPREWDAPHPIGRGSRRSRIELNRGQFQNSGRQFAWANSAVHVGVATCPNPPEMDRNEPILLGDGVSRAAGVLTARSAVRRWAVCRCCD
jgi:hypothetical protein